MSVKDLPSGSSKNRFNRDLKESTKLAVGVLTPWYDQLVTSFMSIPPLQKSKSKQEQEKEWIKEKRNECSTKELRLKWKSSLQTSKRKWIRCEDGSGLEKLQAYGIDVVAYVAAYYRSVFIEEKIRFDLRGVRSFAFETESCSNPKHETPGWGSYCLAEWMLCGYWDKDRMELTCKLLDFPKLKDWAWSEINKVGLANVETSLHWHHYRHDAKDQTNHSVCYFIPYRDMPPGVLLKEFTLQAPLAFRKKLELEAARKKKTGK